MPATAYWDLHDRYRSSPLAEEIAWVAATGSVPGDECDAGCVLFRLNQTLREVASADKQTLLALVDEIERRCGA